MHGSETLTLFRRLVQQEIDCAQRLIGILEAENRALEVQDPETLDQCSGQKQHLLVEMTRHVTAQEGFLAAQRLPPGREGMNRFIAELGEDAEERRLWRQLEELARACRDGNEINGNIITLSRVRVQRALEVLRGPGDTGKTYGREGATHLAKQSNSFGMV